MKSWVTLGIVSKVSIKDAITTRLNLSNTLYKQPDLTALSHFKQ